MPALPSSLALTTIGDGASIIAADHRNNYTAVQTAVNAIVGVFSNGSVAGDLMIWDAAAVKWVPYSAAPTASKIGSARAKSTIAQSIPNNTLTSVTLSTTDWLNGGITFGSSALTVPVAGIYLMNVADTFAASGVVNVRYIELRRQNSIAVLQEAQGAYNVPLGGGFFSGYTATVVMQAAAGDSFYHMVQQDSGGPLNLNSALMSVTKIG